MAEEVAEVGIKQGIKQGVEIGARGVKDGVEVGLRGVKQGVKDGVEVGLEGVKRGVRHGSKAVGAAVAVDGGHAYMRLKRGGSVKSIRMEPVFAPIVGELPRAAFRTQAVTGLLDTIVTKLQTTLKKMSTMIDPLLPGQIGQMVRPKTIGANSPMTEDFIERLHTIIKQRPTDTSEYLSETVEAIRKAPYNPTNDVFFDAIRVQASDEIATALERFVSPRKVDEILLGGKSLLDVGDEMWDDVGRSIKKLEHAEKTAKWLDVHADDILTRDLIADAMQDSFIDTSRSVRSKQVTTTADVHSLLDNVDDDIIILKPFSEGTDVKDKINKNLAEFDSIDRKLNEMDRASAPIMPDNLPPAVPPGGRVGLEVGADGVDMNGLRHFDGLSTTSLSGSQQLLYESGETVASAIVVRKGASAGFVVGMVGLGIGGAAGVAVMTYTLIKDLNVNRDIIKAADEATDVSLTFLDSDFDDEEEEEGESPKLRRRPDHTKSTATTTTTATSTTTKATTNKTKKEKKEMLFASYFKNVKSVRKHFPELHYLIDGDSLAIIPIDADFDTINTLPIATISTENHYLFTFEDDPKAILINNTSNNKFVISHYRAKVVKIDNNELQSVALVVLKMYSPSNPNNLIPLDPVDPLELYKTKTTSTPPTERAPRMFGPGDTDPQSDSAITNTFTMALELFDQEFADLADSLTKDLSRDVTTYLYGFHNEYQENVALVSHGKHMLNSNETIVLDVYFNITKDKNMTLLVKHTDTFVFNQQFIEKRSLHIINVSERKLDVQCYLTRIINSVKEFLVIKFYYGHKGE